MTPRTKAKLGALGQMLLAVACSLIFLWQLAHGAPPEPPQLIPQGEKAPQVGHYATSVAYAEPGGQIPEAIYQPGFVGVQVRRDWVDFEPEKGRYDWTRAEQDLASVRAHGMRLIILIDDRSYTTKVPTPPYLAEYNKPATNGNWSTVRWDPYVAARMQALVREFGAKFDGDPNLEGIGFQETSLGLTDADKAKYGYTPERYRDVITANLDAARLAFRRSRVFWYMNFLDGHQSYLSDIARRFQLTNVAMGGPDVLPESSSLIRLVYPLYTEFAGKLPLFGSMQNDSYRHPKSGAGRYYTMEEMRAYAINELHVRYIFWEYRISGSPADSLKWKDALPVVAAHPKW